MKQLLSKYLGQSVEINFGGGTTVTGKILDIIENVVQLEDDDETIFYVPLDKICVLREVKGKEKTVGFMIKPSNKE